MRCTSDSARRFLGQRADEVTTEMNMKLSTSEPMAESTRSRREIAAILARGYLRLVREQAQVAIITPPSENIEARKNGKISQDSP